MKIKRFLKKYKLNPASLYIIKAGLILMISLYAIAGMIWLLLGSAADFSGLTSTLSGLLEAAPACFGSAFVVGLVCDLWLKEYVKD